MSADTSNVSPTTRFTGKRPAPSSGHTPEIHTVRTSPRIGPTLIGSALASLRDLYLFSPARPRPRDSLSPIMKALFLTREYPPNVYGGAGVVVDELTRALGRRIEVEVRCFGEPAPPPPGVVVRGYSPWERIVRGADGPSFSPVLEAFSVGLAMARDRVDADVAHAHTWYAALAGLLIRALHQTPLVVTMHSLEPLRPWKVDQLGRGYLASTAVERHAVESADRVVAVSEAMRQDVLRLFPVDPARVVVLHNGVDVERYRRTADRAALTRYGVRDPYVLFVGRISEQKGIFDLLRAVPLLPDSLQIVLCAASPDTPELEARLRQA